MGNMARLESVFFLLSLCQRRRVGRTFSTKNLGSSLEIGFTPPEGLIFIILCDKEVYVHLGLFEIGFVLGSFGFVLGSFGFVFSQSTKCPFFHNSLLILYLPSFGCPGIWVRFAKKGWICRGFSTDVELPKTGKIRNPKL